MYNTELNAGTDEFEPNNHLRQGTLSEFLNEREEDDKKHVLNFLDIPLLGQNVPLPIACVVRVIHDC